MAEVDLWGCPRCGASVKGIGGFCRCGHYLGVEPPESSRDWKDIGISPLLDRIERDRILRDIVENRSALGLPPLVTET